MSDIYFLIFPILFSLIVAGYTYYLKKLIEKRNKVKEFQACLSLQREEIETNLYEIASKLTDSSLRFSEANHLFYIENDFNITLSNNVKDDSFFVNLGINLHEIKVENGFVTCLMPFHKNFNKLYSVIKNACIQSDLTCYRSDEEYIVGNILKYTIELILKSQIIIAVMDGRNPNVFYEIGIAHSIGKPVILLANYSKMDKIPFNLKSNRFIFYKSFDHLNSELNKALKAVCDDRTQD